MLLGFVICGSCWITTQKEGRSQRKKKKSSTQKCVFHRDGFSGLCCAELCTVGI